jgi:hypothetical protein
MKGKLTKAQRDFQRSLARTIIEVAERAPLLRGPWIFDEDELQLQANEARRLLGRRGARNDA